MMMAAFGADPSNLNSTLTAPEPETAILPEGPEASTLYANGASSMKSRQTRVKRDIEDQLLGIDFRTNADLKRSGTAAGNLL